MTPTDIRDVFKFVFNGKPNFITPRVLEFRKAGPLLIEVSEGEGFETRYIYGVTVLELVPEQANAQGVPYSTKETGNVIIVRRNDLSKAFISKSEADTYIKALKVTT